MTPDHSAQSQESSDPNPIQGTLKHLEKTQGICAQTDAYFFGAREYRTIANTHDLKLLLYDRYERGQSPDALASLHLHHTCRLPNGPVF